LLVSNAETFTRLIAAQHDNRSQRPTSITTRNTNRSTIIRTTTDRSACQTSKISTSVDRAHIPLTDESMSTNVPVHTMLLGT
jgi:hypothetical protein